jgi:predicted cobalt transporter CbtA
MQRRMQASHGNWNAALIAVAVYIVLMALAYFALPPVDEVPKLFSASLLWNFRVAAIGIQAVIWATLGLLFGVLAQREMERVPARRIASA